MFSVNTNAGALSALQNLQGTNQSLATTQTRINTGLKVSSARDNAAAYSIAQKMRGDIAGLNAAKSSLDRASSEVDVALAGAQAVSDLLISMKEKAVAAKDAGLDANSRSALNDDFQQLKAQITSIVQNASFNGKNLLTGDSLSAITTSDGSSANTISTSVTQLTLSSLALDTSSLTGTGVPNVAVPAGTTPANMFTDTGQANQLQAFNSFLSANYSSVYNDPASYDQATGTFSAAFTFDPRISTIQNDFNAAFGVTTAYYSAGGGALQLGLASGTLYVSGTGASATFSTSAVSGTADAAVTSIDAAISTVNSVLSKLGSTSNRLDTQKGFAGKLSDALTTGVGNLVDANLAKESANLQSYQTKQQLGLQALSIANQGPQSILSLFR